MCKVNLQSQNSYESFSKNFSYRNIIFCNFYNFPGVVNVIHGQHDAVNFICDHPDIRAISFVGGDVAGK